LAAGTYKGTSGHHPLMAWCGNTGESLALLLRTGSAGSNTISDHIDVLEQATTQIPARYRRHLLITLDGAGASHGLVNHITNLNASPWRRVHYSIGWDLGTRERAAIARAPQHTWNHVLDTEGAPRDLGGRSDLERDPAVDGVSPDPRVDCRVLFTLGRLPRGLDHRARLATDLGRSPHQPAGNLAVAGSRSKSLRPPTPTHQTDHVVGYLLCLGGRSL
jgi:hypothetical protein